VHLLYRRDTLPVQQPHSVPLQFLAETGVIGALLGIGAFLLLTVAAIKMVRARPRGPDRLLAAALLGGVIGYGVHCLYDWDWNIPALSLPAFLFLGVTAARFRSGSEGAGPGSALSWPGGSARGLALAALTVCLCVFGLSVELPQLAADKASAALVSASSSSASTIRDAQAQAALASRLDPLSDAGLVAEATIAVRRSQPALARVNMLAAVERNPSDQKAWEILAQVDLRLGSRQWLVAVQRAIDLDPKGHFAQTIVAQQLGRAPASSSATRFPTPSS
jgi:hypothetical protein